MAFGKRHERKEELNGSPKEQTINANVCHEKVLQEFKQQKEGNEIAAEWELEELQEMSSEEQSGSQRVGTCPC